MDNDNEKSEKNEMVESISNMSESTISKENIEERYNKLRGLAVKLKKKVSDLSDQIKHLESEKTTLYAEKEEMQQKIIQISNNAKKLQVIQLEYDKLQDKLENQKSENKKLMKNVETLVDENASIKESFYNEKDSSSQLLLKHEQLSKDKIKLESTVKHLQDQLKSLSEELSAKVISGGQKNKDYDALKSDLESQIQAHKNTRLQLDSIKQEKTNNSVLSLEVENYEKSIEDMKLKLKDEELKRKSLEQTINEHLETISLLNKQTSELRTSCLKKSNQVTNLEEKNENLKAEINEMRLEIETMQREIEDFISQLKNAQTEKSNLLTKIETLESIRDSLQNEFKKQKDLLKNQLRDTTGEISHLNSALANSKKETESLQEEFNGYKRRAQSVLRTKQNQSKEIGIGGKSIVELEEELVQSQQQNTHLQGKLTIYEEKLESLSKEVMILKEEKNHTLESLQESNRRQNNLRHEISSLTEQGRTQELKIQKLSADHKKELENMVQSHKIETRTIREKLELEIHDLKFELEKLKLTESSDIVRVNISPERVVDSNTDFNHQNRLLEIPLVEREECEGSESIDSCPINLNNEERHRKHSLIPLDELLNSSDDYSPPEIPQLPQIVSRQEFEVCERRVKHLTILLADAERDIAKLTQLNEILKEDIRRQQRSVEREQHANNFEYLKNVVFKFVTLKNGDERSHLIPVLNTILKLSPGETQKLYSVAGGKSWIPGIL